jgi:hypothetical protein
MTRSLLHRMVPALALAALAACAAPVAEVPQRRAVAHEPLPPMKNFGPARAAAPERSNTDIARDFLRLFFEMESGRTLDTFTRFEGPVRVRMTGAVPGQAADDLARLLARLRAEAGIDIAAARPGESAQITVEFLPRAAMQAVVPFAACFVVPRVSSWAAFRANRRGPLTDWAALTVREEAAVFIPADVAPQEVRDCLHEEIAQALGPLNDLYELSDSVFNDDNFHTVLTGFDMLVLRAAYAPDLRSGMSRAEVAARLPGVLARLNPAGVGRGSAGDPGPTPRAWKAAIETALGPRTPPGARREAAARALAIAEAAGWQDNRRAFSHFAVARLSLAGEVERAVVHFAAAARLFRALPGGAIHVAHVDMQMAAFALSSGQADEAIRLVDRALPAVRAAENAALLATLLMIRAEALDLLGRGREARAARLDSLAWGRYGFGAETAVRARAAEIAALVPRAVQTVAGPMAPPIGPAAAAGTGMRTGG